MLTLGTLGKSHTQAFPYGLPGAATEPGAVYIPHAPLQPLLHQLPVKCTVSDRVVLVAPSSQSVF